MKCKHKNCFYRRKVNGNGDSTCDYILITGTPRNCPAEDCDKYIPKTKRVRSQIAFGEVLK